MIGRTVGVVALLALWLAPPAIGQQPADEAGGAKDHAAAVKESLQSSMAAIRQYQWVETTAVSLKGEEKSRSENSCYYGADGKLQKTPVGAPAQDSGRKKRGVRGKVVENKTEEFSDAVNEAVSLIKQYVPPDPARIQAAKDAGRVTVSQPDANGHVHLVVADYIKPGDSLTLDVDASSDRISGVTISTFTDSAKDGVGLHVAYGSFADGTVYPATIRLDIAAQKLSVAIENSGYKKLGG